MYVYFLREQGTSSYKIGRASNPERRLRQLQTGCAKPLEVVIRIRFDSTIRAERWERALHRRFASNHIRGEWFDFSESYFNEVRKELKRAQWLAWVRFHAATEISTSTN